MLKHNLLIFLVHFLACCAGKNFDTPRFKEFAYSTPAGILEEADVSTPFLPFSASPIGTIAAPVTTVISPSQPLTNVSLGTSKICNFDFSEYTNINNSYYYFVRDRKLNWFDATYYCRSLGAHLVSLDDIYEFEAISRISVRLANIFSSERFLFWTSGNDLGHEGVFKWLRTGQKFTLPKHTWQPTQPDNHKGDENCINTGRLHNRFVMNDNNCYHEINFICELEEPQIVALNVQHSEEHGPDFYTSKLNKM